MKTVPTPPIWIDTSAQLAQCIACLTKEPIIAVDTESDSLYSYYEKVCLVQISTPTSDYLIDPLNTDVAQLGPLFAEPSIQKVFHAAEYDILSLKRDYEFSFANLFDTMLAAKILGWPRFGLGPILEEHFGVTLNKRFQRYNWGKRPLSKEALNYARFDTHFLLRLRDIQHNELRQQKRTREAKEAFARQTRVSPSPKVFDPDDFWRVKNSKRLSPDEQAILRELFITRDRIARKIDRPVFKVMNDATLVRLSEMAPQSVEQLKQVKGVGSNLLKYNSQDILKAIEKGKAAPPPRYQSRQRRPDDDTLSRYEILRHWRNDLASERGVEPDVIISNGLLMKIARHNPQTVGALTEVNGLGEWQLEKYGSALLSVLDQI